MQKYYILNITIYMRRNKRYLIQTRSQAITSGSILPKVHGVDKWVNLNVKPEKANNKVISYTSKSHVNTESKDQYHVKPRKGQGRAGIKKKMLRFLCLNHMLKQNNQNYCQEEDISYK